MGVRKPSVFFTASDDLRSEVSDLISGLPHAMRGYVLAEPGSGRNAATHPGVGEFNESLKNADLLIGVVSERAHSIHPYSRGEASQLAWEIDLARQHGLDLRLFRKAGLNRSKVNPTHATFINRVERDGIVALYTNREDLSEKVKSALRLWLLDYWRLLLENRKKRLLQVDAACFVALAVAASAVAGATSGWLSIAAAATAVLICTVASVFSLTLLD